MKIKTTNTLTGVILEKDCETTIDLINFIETVFVYDATEIEDDFLNDLFYYNKDWERYHQELKPQEKYDFKKAWSWGTFTDLLDLDCIREWIRNQTIDYIFSIFITSLTDSHINVELN